MRFLPLLFVSVLMLLTSCLGDPPDSLNKQLELDITAIDNYLTSNSVTNAIKDITGVRYAIQTLGTGYTPRLSDKVTFDYTGKLLNGTVFDSGTLTNTDITGQNGLIAGFQIALPQIPVGSSATIYVPSGYGYGTQAQTNIPANSVLIFTIKLKGIQVTTTEQEQLGDDTVKIDEYLTNQAIANVVKDTTGLRYVITQLGAGDVPTLHHRVSVTYTGYILANGIKSSKFSEGSNEPGKYTDSRLVNFIRGFQYGLMKLPKGSKATFYIPSGLGFGKLAISGGFLPVPENSNLIYDVELVDVLSPNAN